MQLSRSIVRVLFLITVVFMLVRLNIRSEKNTRSIAQFKFDTFEKVRKDSLDSKHKMTTLYNETSRFMDESSQVKAGIQQLGGLLGLFVVVEVAFLILLKRNSRK